MLTEQLNLLKETQILHFHRFEAVCLLNDQVVFQDLLPERVSSTFISLDNFFCDFRLLTDVNEWRSYGCSNEGTYTSENYNFLLVIIHQKTKIEPKITLV